MPDLTHKQAEVLQNDDSFATTVVAILYAKYGTEFFDWDPVNLALQIKQDFGFEPDVNLKDKIQAVVTLFTTDQFFASLQAYAAISNAFSHRGQELAMFTPPDADDCAWGCLEAKLLLGMDYTGKFTADIASYVGMQLDREGVSVSPTILQFAKPPEKPDIGADMYDEIMYRAQYENQQEVTDQFETGLNNRLATLLAQLKNLPLEKLQTQFVDGLLQKLQQSVQKI